MEVIAESLRVSQRSHLFNWLQGGFQYLIGHEVMIFGIKSQESEAYQYEYFASTRYFSDERFNVVIDSLSGLVSHAIKIWNKSGSPYFVSNQEMAAMFSNYIIANGDAEKLKQSELKNFTVRSEKVLNVSAIECKEMINATKRNLDGFPKIVRDFKVFSFSFLYLSPNSIFCEGCVGNFPNSIELNLFDNLLSELPIDKNCQWSQNDYRALP